MISSSRYERVFAGVGPRGHSIAEAAHRARLMFTQTDSATDSVAVIGTQCIGMSIAAFLFWVRENCEKDGLGQAVFLARDGELPLRMAQAMPRDHWHGIDLEYLHCGRKSWSVAAASAMGVETWVDLGTADQNAFLRHAEGSLSLSRLLDRVGVSVELASGSDLFSGIDFEAPLPTEEVGRWHQFLLDGKTLELIETESKKRKALLIDSLRQSSIAATPQALVDVGWRGQQSWMISALYREALDIDPLHLHIGGSGISPHIDANISIRRFAFDGDQRPSPIDNVITCLEMFLGAGQARLAGYCRLDDGTVAEVFDAPQTNVKSEGISSLWSGAVALAASLPSRADQPNANSDLTDLSKEVCELLSLFWDKPTSTESKVLQELRLEIDDAGAIVSPVVEPYRVVDFLKGDSPDRLWRSGSLAATRQPTKLLVGLYHALRKVKGLD